MMRAIQNSAGNIFIKIFLGLIAASFALWGVGDMFRGGGDTAIVMSSGDRAVSTQEYSDEMQMRFAALRQVMGASFTPEMAQQLGINQQVLNDLKTGLLIQLEAQELGLRIPKSEIMKQLRETSAFQVDGSFSKENYQYALRRAGISEERFINALEKETLSQLILKNFDSYSPPLNQAAQQIFRAREESRNVTLYRFTPKVTPVKAADLDENVIADYYKQFGEQFRRPEYRQISYITIDPEQISKAIDLGDESLMKLYEDQKESLSEPEKREVSQLLYENREQADKALDLLQKGNDFAAVIKQLPPLNDLLSLGSVAQEQLPSEAQEIVFTLEKGKSSTPVETDFGWHVFRVEAITPKSTPEFSQVRDSLKAEAMRAQLEDRLYDLTVELEDSHAAGVSLQEAAVDFELTAQTLEMADATGQTPEGKQIAANPLNEKILEAAFSLEDPVDSKLVETASGGYLFVVFDESIESIIPPLEQIRDEVAQAAAAKQLREAAYLQATELAKKVQADSSQLSQLGAKQTNLSNLKRSADLNAKAQKQLTEIPPALLQDIFSRNKGQLTNAYVLDAEQNLYALAKVNQIKTVTAEKARAKSNETEINKIEAQLQKSYRDELLSAYLDYLETKYPIEINQAALDAPLR